MRSFAVDANNDLFLDASGNLAFVTGVNAVGQNCQTAVKAQRGEMILAMNKGMPTRATAWDQYNPSQFEAAVRSIILSVDGVLSITAFAMVKQDNDLKYVASIHTIYGPTQING